MSEHTSNNLNSGLNILIVNSDSSLVSKIQTLLQKTGYTNIVSVSRVREALGILRKQPVDFLICDIDLDELDGWRVSRLVRSNALRCSSQIPIIVTTSTWCERIAEVTAREYGINHMLVMDDMASLPQLVDSSLNSEVGSSKSSLLVIEDDEDTADLINRILSGRYNLEVAMDGEEGLAAWKNRRHDLVLLDVKLPKMDGSSVLESILSIQENQPVVIMTAHASEDQAVELLINGASDFINKPFRPEELRSVTEVALRRDDYMVSNKQFADRVRSLAERESAFREVSEVHRHLLNNLQSVVMELDSEFNIIFLNEAWTRTLGFEILETLNKPFKYFLADKDGRKFRAIESQFRSVFKEEQSFCEMEVLLQDKQKQLRWVQLRVSRSSRANRENDGLTICLDDISSRKEAQKKLEFMALHDSLTGLYNRNYFEMTLLELSLEAKDGQTHHGLLYMDLDYFKVINDTFGHNRGDKVLRQLVDLTSGLLREKDIFCRFSGDEFAIVLPNVDKSTAIKIAETIRENISEAIFKVNQQSINMSCSIGISFIDGNVDSSNEYLIRADVALYVAKHRGRDNVHVYNPEDKESEDLRKNIDWARRIRQAIQNDRLVLYFQPILNIKSGNIDYHEVLIRLQDESGKIILPGEFIPALESTGDMGLLDRWVIKQSISLLSQHPELNSFAINLSAQAFRDENLVPIIRESLESCGVDGSLITFELTESASLSDLKITKKVISELHQLGCNFAVDDFGSGFSSFAYLKELPADYIKLDGSFIQNLHTDKVDQALVRSIIEVVQTLGRKTVAEFVENKEILHFLQENDVDYAQGYFIGRPVPIEEIKPLSSIVKDSLLLNSDKRCRR